MLTDVVARAMAESIEAVNIRDCADEVKDEVTYLLAGPLSWYLSHPNWPSGFNSSGRIPLEISVAMAPDGRSAIRYGVDITDYRQGMADNWGRYVDCAKYITGTAADQTYRLWDLLARHLNGIPPTVLTRMLHGAGYGSSGFRRAALYFNMRWLSYSRLKKRFPQYVSAIEKNLNECGVLYPSFVEWISYDFIDNEIGRTKCYWQLDPTSQTEHLSDIAGTHPDLTAAGKVFEHFRESGSFRNIPRSIGLQLGFDGKMEQCRQKLYFACLAWSWSQSQGLLELITYLSDTFSLDLEALYEFLGVFSEHKIRLTPTLVAIGPHDPPGVTFYFFPVLEKSPSTILSERMSHSNSSSNLSALTGGLSPVELAEELCVHASSYLVSTREEEGYWTDFTVQSEPSDEWVTAYITATLSEDPLVRPHLIPSAEWLHTQFRPGEGWGYNHQATVDADSTALGVLALHRMGRPVPESVQDALLRFRLPTGGYQRFSRQKVSHRDSVGPAEITSRVLTAQMETGMADPDMVCDAVVHLLSQQKKEGRWNTFWWNDDLYATCRALQALNTFVQFATSDTTDDLRSMSLLESTVDAFGRARSFISAYAVPDEPFLLGLWLTSWFAAKGDFSYPSVDRVVCHLSSLQQEDGRWLSVPLRQIARTKSRRSSAPFGMGKLYLDMQCLITTATVIEGLRALQRALKAK